MKVQPVRGKNIFSRTLLHPASYYTIQIGGLLGITYFFMFRTQWKEGTIFYDIQQWAKQKRNSILTLSKEEVERQKEQLLNLQNNKENEK
ncbi:hypothetical protein ABK040_002144 [Willaertia magna]